MTDITIANDFQVADREVVAKLLKNGLLNRLHSFHFNNADIDRLAISLADYLLTQQPQALTLARINQKICGLLLISKGTKSASDFLKQLRQTVSLKLTMQFSFFLWVAGHQLQHHQTTNVELLAVANEFQGTGLENRLLQFASNQLPAGEQLSLYTNNPAADNDRYQEFGFKPVDAQEANRQTNDWHHWIFTRHNLKTLM